MNPSLQELSSSTYGSSANTSLAFANLNGSGSVGVLGGIPGQGSSNRVDTPHANSIQQLPNVSSLSNAGSLPMTLSVSNGANDSDQLKALLPAYRQAPDYNTAVQIKYGGPVVPVANSSNEALYENHRKVSVDVSTI